MAEILTESFCERCGTRYTFEAAIPKKHRIGRLKVLSKGLKNYVLSEDASLDEALAEARSDEEREVSGGQLEAFHQTFQFCMSCRQYTCANCWNEDEGRCLSCAPLSLGGAQLRSPLDDLLAGGGMAPFAPPAPVDETPATAAALETNGHVPPGEPAANGSAWPTIDLFRAAGEPPATELPAPSPLPEAVLDAPVTEAPVAEAGIETPADDSVAPAAAEAEPTTDFWTRPFTGFAPQPEPANGHRTEPEPAPAEQPAVVAEPAAELDPVGHDPVPESLAEPLPDVAAMAGLPEPTSSAAPELRPMPADAQADDRAAELAAELADRTSRLLGRFRVQPRSAGATAGEQAAAASAAADAAAAREAAAALAASAPAAIEPQVGAQPETPAAAVEEVSPAPVDSAPPIASAPPAQPSWTFAAPAAAPEPAPEPALQAWPEPVAWGKRKSEAMIAGTLESPILTEEPAEPVADESTEPVVAEAAPGPVVAQEPLEATPAAAPGPVVTAEPVPAPVATEPAPLPPATAPATDRIEMPAWPTLARPRLSDSAPVPQRPVLPPVQGPAQAPQWPAPLRPDLDASSTPFWASGEAGRTAGALDVWDASVREVTSAPGIAANPVGVQSCVSCGLSLSATARFCRRCGSRQG